MRPLVAGGRRVLAWLITLVDALTAVVIAPDCAACGTPLGRPHAGPVCESCWIGIRIFTPPICDGCGDPVASAAGTAGRRGMDPANPAFAERASDRSHDSRTSVDLSRVVGRGAGCQARLLCAGCRDVPRTIARARAVGPYDDHLRDIIHAFKYGQRRTLAPPLSALMARHGRAVLEGADVSVAVPLHWRRRRERGFNQAALLAAGLGLPVWHALRRRRRTRAQVELPADERHRNVEHAFALTWRVRLLQTGVGMDLTRAFRRLRPRNTSRPLSGTTGAGRGRGCGWWWVPEVVVLVDDVSTTGATLEACARVLKQAGVKEVRALTAARVASRPT